MTQCDQVLRHLKAGRTITAMQAMHIFGICCLAERIRDLRARGHSVYAEWVTLPSKRRCVRYSL